MKSRGLGRVDRRRLRSLDRRSTRTDKSPPVSAAWAYREPTVCTACRAVFARKTWRRSVRRLGEAFLRHADHAPCPACRQVADGRFYGRVLLSGKWLEHHESEVRRRITNVEARARHTQPERRLVRIARKGRGLEVTTTSQKLAHRVVHEVEKAFGGRASYYCWSDREGFLLASWTRD